MFIERSSSPLLIYQYFVHLLIPYCLHFLILILLFYCHLSYLSQFLKMVQQILLLVRDMFATVLSLTHLSTLPHICPHYHTFVHTTTHLSTLPHICPHCHTFVHTTTHLSTLPHICQHYHTFVNIIFTSPSIFFINWLTLVINS